MISSVEVFPSESISVTFLQPQDIQIWIKYFHALIFKQNFLFFFQKKFKRIFLKANVKTWESLEAITCALKKLEEIAVTPEKEYDEFIYNINNPSTNCDDTIFLFLNLSFFCLFEVSHTDFLITLNQSSFVKVLLL